MKDDVKKKWVAALRSGKYKQGCGALRRNDEYCCLGVLCDVYRKETGKRWVRQKGHEEFAIHQSTGGLPTRVREWAGLDQARIDLDWDGKNESVVLLNDVYRVPFEKLADAIEEQL
jgi:hypothetical protein